MPIKNKAEAAPLFGKEGNESHLSWADGRKGGLKKYNVNISIPPSVCDGHLPLSKGRSL
jgi:hypothetical protein